MAFDPTGVDADDLPDIDDRLVEPGTRYEMLDGELVYVAPADDPHAERQSQLCALIEVHTGPEFKVAADLLTRTSKVDDFAPDVSVYLAARDPVSRRRQLAQLAFEVVSTQTLSNAGRKAAKLAARGVRRVFAIDVERSRALEWSAALGGWSLLHSSGDLADPALRVPLPIESLIHSAQVDDAVARALLAKNNAVLAVNRAEGIEEGLARGIAEGLARGKAEGIAEGLARGKAEGIAEGIAEGLAQGEVAGEVKGRAKAVVDLLAVRGIAVDPDMRERILAERDPARLHRWFARAVTCVSSAELLAEP
jgi:Uma2 family endonuclease